MKKNELKLLLDATKAENEAMEEYIKELRVTINKQSNDICNMRINKDKEILKLENRIKELETTIRVLQNI